MMLQHVAPIPMATSVAMEDIINTINLGLIVVDAGQSVRIWNGWIARHSGIEADAAVGSHIQDVFSEIPSRAFLSAVTNTLNYGLPVVLSNALHRSPLALYERLEDAEEKKRIHQSITLTPISDSDGNRCCLIQITDSSTSIKREKILRSHSEVLKKEATTDSLTGIYNRRFFDEHYKMAMGNALRHNLPLAVFMVDIDLFKQYNDCYGHLAGDRTLIQVATTLKKQLMRATDVVARYGGEEFIVMLPNMDTDSAMRFAERLRDAIWNLNIPHNKSHHQRVTISVGFSSYLKQSNADPQHLLKTADAALYMAKNSGRNQCSFLPLP
ncbi:GGDEF domain-containing protein [Undibacterium sp. SXout7W]|uniref:GGDEF domain-containing protein n=1 Tax=Undibacterium sp. SXout7W TaxID=3413049 RepID=UPI003BF29F8C